LQGFNFAMKYKPPKIIKEKLFKKESQRQFWKVFLIEGGLFFLTSLLSIVSAFKLNQLVTEQKVYLPKISLQDFIFSFLLVTFCVLLFVLYKKHEKLKEIIYKGLFLITCFWGGMTVLNLWLPVFGSILIMGILIILWIKNPLVFIHDLLMILGLAGTASFFGLGFSPSIVVILLVLFSFYDFIAVYKTKHMVLMAKDMIEKKVILGFIVPQKIENFREDINKSKLNSNFLILGGGDIVFPSLLAVSVVPYGFSKAFTIIIFSLMGSFLSYWIFSNQKKANKDSGFKKEPMPALPPVALLSIIGYFITLLF